MADAGSWSATCRLDLERDVHPGAGRVHRRLVVERSAALARLDCGGVDGGGHRHGAVALAGSVWIVIGMVLLVVVTGVVFSLFSQNSKENASLAGLDGTTLKPAITSTIDTANGSPITFDNGAVTVIDVWEDPQCPVCKLFEDANGDYIESLIREKKATVRYHVLSFLGDESVRAANASFCAADEGQYLDFHHALYAVQSPLENSGFWSNETLVNIGKKIDRKSVV